MTFERILSHFQVRKRGTGKAQCICPAHADTEASLTRNSMRATADKVTECMDGIRELNELEGQLETEKQESEDKI